MTLQRHLLALTLTLLLSPAWGAPPTVEIVAMAHPPVVAALKPLRDWLARQGGTVRLVETDAESPAGVKRLASVGLAGHIPILILIDGRYQFQQPGGGKLELVRFPNSPDSPPGMRGTWTPGDVRTLVQARMEGPAR